MSSTTHEVLLLAAFLLCLRAAISRDSRRWRLAAVGVAFLPSLLRALSYRLLEASIEDSHQFFTISHQFVTIASAVASFGPPLFLIAWAIWSSDPMWLRVTLAIVGVFAALDVVVQWPRLTSLPVGIVRMIPVPQGAN